MQIFIIFFTSFYLFFSPLLSENMVNPITDVCWKCLFPIHFAGKNVTGNKKDFVSYHAPTCACAGKNPKVGLPLAYWEPTYLVDVTRHPYKMVALGGIQAANSTPKNMGSVSNSGGGLSTSFYHVHLYRFPVLSLLSLFDGFDCIDKGEVDCLYMSELDPLWSDEGLALINNAEAGFFANHSAALACIPDCLSCSLGKPLDELFWCSGCSGSLYPFTGHVGHHRGGIQASFLLVHRILAKLHRNFFLKGYPKKEFCEAKDLTIMPKSIYKTQLVYPIPETNTHCHPLGASEVSWGAGKSFPIKGEDYSYLIWKKKHCCIDALRSAAFAEWMNGL